MSHLAHAVRELCLYLPDAVGVVKLDRRQSEARSGEFGFRVCGEVVT